MLLCGPCNRTKENTLTLTGLRRENQRVGFMAGQDVEARPGEGAREARGTDDGGDGGRAKGRERKGGLDRQQGKAVDGRIRHRLRGMGWGRAGDNGRLR